MRVTFNNVHLSILNQYASVAQEIIDSDNYEKQVSWKDDGVEVNLHIEDEKQEDAKIRISSEITSILIGIIKENLLKDYIRKNYKDVELEEEWIYKHALNLFNKKENLMKEAIFYRVYEYIYNNNHIDIDGFVKFRMKDLANYISKISDIAVEEYLIKKDQDEFINVLKYFIEAQDEKIDLVKLYILKDGTFLLCDKNDKTIENTNEEDMMNMVLKENLNYEDFLISTLLTLCPKEIIIYDDLESNISKEIIEMIESIFEGKVRLVYKN